MTTTPLLAIEKLSISYGAGHSRVMAADDVSLAIPRGTAYGLIGESGSGKTTIAFAILRYLRGASIEGGRILLEGANLLSLDRKSLTALRGRSVSMVYQDPLSALNPLMRIGEQVAEAVRRRGQTDSREVRNRVEALLAEVHLPNPAEMARRFPHQLSGGQQQRVVIAMALASAPDLLIMDEPTTGLDVTTEAVILDLIAELRRKHGLTILFISHNLAVVSKVCDRVGVLSRGVLVEEGDADSVLRVPQHPYTQALLAAVPRVIRPDATVSVPPTPRSLAATPQTGVLLRVCGLHKTYGGHRGLIGATAGFKALDDVSFGLGAAETLAIVGESGSGKSTLARCVAGLTDADAGEIAFDARPLDRLSRRRGRDDRRHIQIVFQNPEASLNPQHTVARIVARPLQLYGLRSGRSAIMDRVAELLESVRLDARLLNAYPAQLSGGQKQRVSLARALAAEPRLIVCDEPTSALDICVQAQLLHELKSLQERLGTSLLFISHDLGVVSTIAHRVAVMHRGKIIETGLVSEVFANPAHAYTRTLLEAVPTIAGLPSSRNRQVAAERVP